MFYCFAAVNWVLVVFLVDSAFAQTELEELKIEPSQATGISEDFDLTLICTYDNTVTDVQWVLNEEQQQETSVLAVANKVLLDFKVTGPSMNGLYTCGGYSPSLKTHITVSREVSFYRPIKFINTNKAQEFEEGEDAVVRCEVSPPANIAWKKEKVDIVGKMGTDRIYTNSSNGNLMIENISQSDQGTYQCLAVQSNKGRFISMDIHADVQYRPSDVMVSPDVVVKVKGDDVTLTCNASADPKPNFKWYRGNVSKANEIKEGIGRNGRDLVISNLTLYDGDNYICQASNKYGEASGGSRLTVQVPPEITSSDVQSENKVGETASIVCAATGVPTPTVVIYRNKKVLKQSEKNETNIVVEHGAGEAKVTFDTATHIDNGEYECKASNDAGNATVVINLNVVYPPRDTSFSNVYGCLGRSAQLRCSFDANPPPTLTWRRMMTYENNSTTETSQPKMMFVPIEVNEDYDVTEDNGTLLLTIRQLRKDSYNKYECTSNNTEGENSASVELIEVEYPSAPTAIVVTDESTSSATVTFSPPINAFVEILSYKVTLTRIDSTSEVVQRQVAAGQSSSDGSLQERFENLEHNSTYSVKIKAENCKGFGEASNERLFTTKLIVPPDPVKINGSDATSTDNYTIWWETGGGGGGNFQRINIIIANVDRPNATDVESREFTGDDEVFKERLYTIKGLQPSTRYKVTVEIFNEIGSAKAEHIFVTAKGTTLTTVTEAQSPSTSVASSNVETTTKDRLQQVTSYSATSLHPTPTSKPPFDPRLNKLTSVEISTDTTVAEMQWDSMSVASSYVETTTKDRLQQATSYSATSLHPTPTSKPPFDPRLNKLTSVEISTGTTLTTVAEAQSPSTSVASSNVETTTKDRLQQATSYSATSLHPTPTSKPPFDPRLNKLTSVKISTVQKNQLEDQSNELKSGSTSLMVVWIVIAAVIIVVIVGDLALCASRHTGISHFVYLRTCATPPPVDKTNIKDVEEGSAEYRKDSKVDEVTDVVTSNEKQPFANEPEPIANEAEPDLTSVKSEEGPLSKTDVEQAHPTPDVTQQSTLSPDDVTMEVGDEQTKELLA